MARKGGVNYGHVLGMFNIPNNDTHEKHAGIDDRLSSTVPVGYYYPTPSRQISQVVDFKI
jgi:hypothetical protein